MRETDPGRLVDSAVFLCGPADPGAPVPHRPVRLEITVRVGVTIHSHQVLNERGETRDLDWTNNIAIGARGGHADRRYFWVQIYSMEDEQIKEDGRATRSEDIARDEELPRAGGEENAFSWAGRSWTIDNNQTASARYSLARPTFGSPNCDTLYDAPSSFLPISRWMSLNPRALRVSKTTQFHSLLYGLPLDPADRRVGDIVRQAPSASVAWSFDEAYGRSAAGQPPEVLEQRYRVHYIHPNGVAPAGMSRPLWRIFHGR